jgi:hypothetical protein
MQYTDISVCRWQYWQLQLIIYSVPRLRSSGMWRRMIWQTRIELYSRTQNLKCPLSTPVAPMCVGSVRKGQGPRDPQTRKPSSVGCEEVGGQTSLPGRPAGKRHSLANIQNVAAVYLSVNANTILYINISRSRGSSVSIVTNDFVLAGRSKFDFRRE